MDVVLLRSYAEQGMTRQEIAEKMGIPFSTVSNNCTKHGIKTKRPDTTGRRPLKESVKITLELRKEGMSYRDIAKRLGVPKDRVAAVCRDHGAGGAIIEQRLTESQVADIVGRSGFTYVGGYQSNKKPVTVRCNECGRTFERQYHIFRDVVNETFGARCCCPHCFKEQHTKERDRKEQQKREAQLREQQRADRRNRELSDELAKRLAIHVCKNCGEEFCQMVTGYNSSSYCSKKCQTRFYNRETNKRRRKKLTQIEHDNDITLEKLFKRDGGVCYLCGELCDWNDKREEDGQILTGQSYPSIDHVMPIAKGGTHTWNNIKLACRKCNSLKRDTVIIPPSA